MPPRAIRPIPAKPLDLAEKLRAAFGGTDLVEIGAPLPPHANPLFAWCLHRYAAGNTAAPNGEEELLGEVERQLLSRIAERPDAYAALVEEFQTSLAPEEQETFANLLADAAGAPNPAAFCTMADARKEVTGVKWLCPRWLPYGMLTEVVGPPGVGKSGLVLSAFVGPVITGSRWFSGAAGLASWKKAIWADTESCMAITLDRIEKWKLPADLILLPFSEDALKPLNLENPEHLRRLYTMVNVHRPHLLVIDSLRGAHKMDENSSRVAGVLENIAALVQRTRIACILIHHTRKMFPGTDITADDARGSNALTALIRWQIGLDKPDPKTPWIRFQVLKENLGRMPLPQGFRITDKGVEFGPAPERPKKDTKKQGAADWLRQFMEPGKWYPSGEIEAAAGRFGYTGNAVQRAKEELGIVMPKYVRKVKGGWECMLPPQETA